MRLSLGLSGGSLDNRVDRESFVRVTRRYFSLHVPQPTHPNALMGETFHFDAPVDREAVCPMHIDCALDRAGLHAIACKRMHKDHYVLHNRLRDLWKRKGVEAGGIVTFEPCTDDILPGTFLQTNSSLLSYTMLSRKLPRRPLNKQRLKSTSSSNKQPNRAPTATR